MQYKVPQNIDQEDKILGPLTFTQFVYALIGGGLLLFEYSLLSFGGFLLVGIPTLILTICFSLVKVQDQPFTRFFVSLLVFLKQPKNRVWQDEDAEKPAPPLGKDFMADVKRDVSSQLSDVKPDDPLAEIIKEPKVLNVAADTTAQSISTSQPATQITSKPAQPARRLTVKTDKGGA